MSGGGNGVTDMGLSNIIRRMHLREKLSIRGISRRTGPSRSTVTMHLAAETVEPNFASPERPSKPDPFGPEAGGLAGDGGGEVTQAAANAEADACRSRCARP